MDSILYGKKARTNNVIRKKLRSLRDLNSRGRNSLSKLNPVNIYKFTFYRLAINLIEKLCHSKPSARYKVDQALQHPWVTRNFDS